MMAIVLVLAGEVAARVLLPYVSGTLRHITEIPNISKKLSESKNTSILFLGNSMINNGIDEGVIRKNIGSIAGTIPTVMKINPDGTDLWDWHFLYKNYIDSQPDTPDIIVLGFRSDFVDDHRRPNPSRLAANFTKRGDLAELIEFNMSGKDEIVEYIIASSICLYAHRDSIRNRLMNVVVPFYKENIEKINTAAWNVRAEVPGEATDVHSYRRLKAFVSLVKAKGGTVVLLAMPIRNKYILRDELFSTAEESGAILLDMRNIRELSPTHFIDAVHLSHAGAKILSRQLAENLTPVLMTKGNEH